MSDTSEDDYDTHQRWQEWPCEARQAEAHERWLRRRPHFAFDYGAGPNDPRRETPKFGMSSDQLADYVDDLVHECTSRIKGTGNEQYSVGDHQKFETMTLAELLQGTLEEIEDTVNYSVMLHIKVRRILDRLKAEGEGFVG